MGQSCAWHFLRTRSRWQLVYVTAAAAVVLIGSVGTTAYLIRENHRSFRLMLLQRQYDDYLLRANDVEKLEQSLVALAAELPADEGVARRLEMVRRREAAASEPNLVRFFMRHHMAHDQVDKSVREANRLLESSPNDWEAQCHLARAALIHGDVKKAKSIVAGLPKADQAANAILSYPILVLDSTNLFLQLGDACGSTR